MTRLTFTLCVLTLAVPVSAQILGEQVDVEGQMFEVIRFDFLELDTGRPRAVLFPAANGSAYLTVDSCETWSEDAARASIDGYEAIYGERQWISMGMRFDPDKHETLLAHMSLALSIRVNDATCLSIYIRSEVAHDAIDRGRRGIHGLASLYPYIAADLDRRAQALRLLLGYIDVR